MKKETIFDIKVWLIVGLVLPFIISGAKNLEGQIVLSVTMFSVLVISFYTHKWLINNYLQEKKWLHYGLGLLAFILISSYIVSFSFDYVIGKRVNNVVLAMVNSLFLLLFSTAISYAYKGILLQIQYEKTKRRQVEAELKLLQSQVNPHFLFNTLNNIYAQNLQNHEEANEMLLQMADLMRYQIESSKKNEVPLEDEIEFLENYIALEKRRLTDKITVSFIADIQENMDVKIPPMLFMPFIENAFKHGINAEGTSFITIHLRIDPLSILFSIENQIPLRKQKVKSTNTGLDNIQKRLALLFGNKHRLTTTTDNGIYNVQLAIQLWL